MLSDLYIYFMEKTIPFSTKYEFFGTEKDAIKGSAPTNDTVDKLPRVWINAAKEGQVLSINGHSCTMTKEGLESSLGTWKDGFIGEDHKLLTPGFKIYEDRFESPFLSFLLDKETAKRVEEAGGGSIDGIATHIKDNKILKMAGVGYSILSRGNTPSCTHEAGCGFPIAGEAPNKEDRNLESESKIKNDGGKENMADEKHEPETMFSTKQVAEIRAAAVAEVTNHLGNEYKAGVADLKTAQTAELKKLGDVHAAELIEQRTHVMEQATMMEKLGTMYALSDEAKKGLTEAKTLEEALTFFAGLKVEKAEPVIAAKDGGQTGGGIIMGGAAQDPGPKVRKVLEVGNFNPITQKWEDRYREEVI